MKTVKALQPTQRRGLVAAIFAFTLLSSGLSAITHSDTLTIPVGQQNTAQQDVSRPSLGMNKTMVEKLFGQADTQHPARGIPPISRWEYRDFVVYFESNIVIHSVLRHRR